jgi:hypothetical protein
MAIAADNEGLTINRAQLATFLPDQVSIRAFENLQKLATVVTPDNVATLTQLVNEASLDATLGIDKANEALALLGAFSASVANGNKVDITVAGAVWTINAGVVTYAKIQNVAASKLLGNPTGTPASMSEITLGTNLTFAGSTLNAAGGGAPGADGAPGAFIRGDDGEDGRDGIPGNTGNQGPPGIDGIVGYTIRGDDGEDGRDSFIPGPQGSLGSGASWTEIDIDFGANPVYEATFTITDAAITSSAVKVIVVPSGKAATGRTADDWQWDGGMFAANPGTGSAACYANFNPGPIVGKRKLQYLVA